MEKMEILRDSLGAEELLDNLLLALNSNELDENAEFIAGNWDIEL